MGKGKILDDIFTEYRKTEILPMLAPKANMGLDSSKSRGRFNPKEVKVTVSRVAESEILNLVLEKKSKSGELDQRHYTIKSIVTIMNTDIEATHRNDYYVTIIAVDSINNKEIAFTTDTTRCTQESMNTSWVQRLEKLASDTGKLHNENLLDYGCWELRNSFSYILVSSPGEECPLAHTQNSSRHC